MDEKELQSVVDQLKAKGASDQEIGTVLQSMVNQQASATAPVSQRKAPADIRGVPDGLIQDVLKGPAKAIATISAGAASGIAGLMGGPDAARQVSQQAIDQGVELPYFGSVNPIGAGAFSQFQQGKSSGVTAGAGMLADLAGTGLETYSLGKAPLTLAGKDGVLKTVFNPNILKAIAPFAAPFAIGRGLQAGADKEGSVATKAKEASMEALGDYAGAAMGFGLLNGGGVLLSRYGGKLMRSAAVKGLSERLGDSMATMRNWVQDGARQRFGETLDYGFANFKRDFEGKVLGLSDAMAEAFRTDVPGQDKIMQHVRNKMSEYIGQSYRARNTLFDKVFNDADVAVTKSPTFQSVIDSTTQWADDFGRSIITKGQAGDEGLNMVQNYLSLANKEKPMNLREAYRLYNEGNNYLSSSGEANQKIREIQRGIMSTMEESIKKSKPELLNQWNQARDFALDVTQNIDNEFAGKITSAAKINNLVDDMLSFGDPSKMREQMQSLLKAFPEQADRDTLSQLMFNSVVDKAKLFDDQTMRAQVIDKAINWAEGFGKNSVINPGHLEQLQQLSRVSNTKFSDAVVNAQRLAQDGGEEFIPEIKRVTEDMVKFNFLSNISKRTNGFRNYSSLGDEISSITSVEELNAVMSLIGDDKEILDTVGKEIVRGIANRNSSQIVSGSGKVNEEALRKQMNGIITDLNKIGGSNKEEIFKQLFGNSEVKIKGVDKPVKLDTFILDMQKSLDSLGSLDNLSGEGLLKAAHLITGLTYGLTSRPVPAIYHLSQLSKINRNSSMPAKELTEVLDNLASEGYVKKSGKLKALGDKLTDATQNYSIPSLMSSQPLEKFLKSAADMMGVDVLSDEDKQSLEAEYNNFGF